MGAQIFVVVSPRCGRSWWFVSGYTDSHTGHTTHTGCGAGCCSFRQSQLTIRAHRSDRRKKIYLNHAETRRGAYIDYGDAVSFHEWEFRSHLRIAGKSGDQYIEAMSKVCDGLRGDAFVAAQEVGSDILCEVIDGRPCGIDTLINHVREMSVSLG